MRSEKRDFNKDAATWDDNPVAVRLAHDFADAISQEVPLTKEMEVLDFGCGTGLVTLGIQPFVKSITGMDSAQGMLDVFAAKIKAKSLSNVTLQLIDMETQLFSENTYDLIMMTMALHHVKDPVPLLERFYGMLKPGGALYLVDLDPEDGLFHDNPDGVFHHGFDRKILRQWLADVGFSETSDRTAAEAMKPVRGGDLRSFSFFLVTGRKML